MFPQQQPDIVAIVNIAIHIARGLRHIHNHNIVHGDLKSTNVLLKSAENTLGYHAKIADFGLSVRLSEAQSEVTHVSLGGGLV